jgi:hypothetical protein
MENENRKVRVLLYGGAGKTQASFTMARIAKKVDRIVTPDGMNFLNAIEARYHNVRTANLYFKDKEGNQLSLLNTLEWRVKFDAIRRNADDLVEGVKSLLASSDADGIILDCLSDLHFSKHAGEVLTILKDMDVHVCLIDRRQTHSAYLESPFRYQIKEDLAPLLRECVSAYIQMIDRDEPPYKGFGIITEGNVPTPQEVEVDFRQLQPLFQTIQHPEE